MLSICFLLNTNPGYTQKANADTTFKPGGKLWGLVFGDLYYKAHADTLNRGAVNQYTGIPKNKNAFQIRRVYLGYTYEISRTFTADFLLEQGSCRKQVLYGHFYFLADQWNHLRTGNISLAMVRTGGRGDYPLL